MSLPKTADEYREKYGKRFRMLKEQKQRGLSRDEAFAEWVSEQGGGFTPPEAPAVPQPKGMPQEDRPVLTATANLCEKQEKCSCKGMEIGYDRDERRIRITDCSCSCHSELDLN